MHQRRIFSARLRGRLSVTNEPRKDCSMVAPSRRGGSAAEATSSELVWGSRWEERSQPVRYGEGGQSASNKKCTACIPLQIAPREGHCWRSSSQWTLCLFPVAFLFFVFYQYKSGYASQLGQNKVRSDVEARSTEYARPILGIKEYSRCQTVRTFRTRTMGTFRTRTMGTPFVGV